MKTIIGGIISLKLIALVLLFCAMVIGSMFYGGVDNLMFKIRESGVKSVIEDVWGGKDSKEVFKDK